MVVEYFAKFPHFPKIRAFLSIIIFRVRTFVLCHHSFPNIFRQSAVDIFDWYYKESKLKI